MRKSSLCILLILISWTLSFGQQFADTTRCYGVTDLRKIALKLTEGQQCDTLLKIANSQILNRDSLINYKDAIITGYVTESSLKESIITGKNNQIQDLNLNLKKTKRKLFFTKLGWITTTLALSATTIYFLVN